MWNAHNTVFGSKRSFLSIKWFAHLYMSIFCHDGHVTWLNSRSLLPVSALFAVCHQLVSDVIENLGEKVSCTDHTGHGNDLKLTPMIKMKTRHPVQVSFGNEFLSINNYCRVMAAWRRKTLTNSFNAKTLKSFNFFCVSFWKNDPLWKNLQNSVPKGFIATLIHMWCANFVKFSWWKSVKLCIPCTLESESNIRLSLALRWINIKSQLFLITLYTITRISCDFHCQPRREKLTLDITVNNQLLLANPGQGWPKCIIMSMYGN